MTEPTPYTADELADLPDPSLWMDAEDLRSMALRLLATVDAERARREQAEAEVATWKERAEESALRSIEARNPGIDMDDVRRRRALDASPTEGNPDAD